MRPIFADMWVLMTHVSALQAARPLNDTFVSLENNTAVAFGRETLSVSSTEPVFCLGDHDLTNFLSLEPDLPVAIGAKEKNTTSSQAQCLVHTISTLDCLVFRFQVAPAQKASPGTCQLLEQVSNLSRKDSG